MNLIVRSAIKANTNPNKPCEDYLYVNETRQIFVVCDGVTRSTVNGVYPIPSPARRAARIIADAFYMALNNDNDPHPDRLRQYVSYANDRLANFNQRKFSQIDYVEHDFACAVAIFAMIYGGALHYVYIGDCYGVNITPDEAPQIFTHPQTAMLDLHKQELGTGRDATITIRRDIRNNKAHPYAYGALTGEATALDFLVQAEIPLKRGQRIILSSDGLADYFQAYPEKLAKATPHMMIVSAEAHEQAQNLRSDDKALIVLDVAI